MDFITCKYCGCKMVNGFICPECGRITDVLTTERRQAIIDAHTKVLGDELGFGELSKEDYQQAIEDLNNSRDYTLIDYAEIYGY